MAGPHVQVIASGAAVLPVARTIGDRVICADGGVRVALAAGRHIDQVVGDLDSADPDDLAVASDAGATIDRFPVAKDETDLELALAAAIQHGPAQVTVHLANGGRLDHQLANLLVLASPRWSDAAVDAWVGDDRVWVVRTELEIPLSVGDPASIQAVGGPARVTTTGLEYPLARETLDPSQARGVANVVRSTPATVLVHEGVVLVINTRS